MKQDFWNVSEGTVKRSHISRFLKRTKDEIDAIELAMFLGNKDLVRYLLSHQKLSLQNSSGDSYLLVAMQYDDEMPSVFFEAIKRDIPMDHLGVALCAAVALPAYYDNTFIEDLLKKDADPANALREAISIQDIPRVLRLMQLPACKVKPQDIKEAEIRFKEAEMDIWYDDQLSSDYLITPGIIKFAIFLGEAIQHAVTNLAKLNKENTIDESIQENISIIENLINDIKNINVPVMCRVEYLSSIINSIKDSLAEHAGIAAGVTFLQNAIYGYKIPKLNLKRLIIGHAHYWSPITSKTQREIVLIFSIKPLQIKNIKYFFAMSFIKD